MSTQHTPGPWEFHKDTCSVNSRAVSDIADCSGAEINADWAGTDYTGKTWRDANARLIAAAPDLLEACIIAFDQTCPVGRPKDWEQLRAAIAKATESAQ